MNTSPAAPVPGHRLSAIGVAEPAAHDLIDLRYAILRHTRHALTDINDLVCTVERSGPRIQVHLGGPPISPALQRALSVRVLDAVRSIGRTYGQVDVTYEADTADTAS